MTFEFLPHHFIASQGKGILIVYVIRGIIELGSAMSHESVQTSTHAQSYTHIDKEGKGNKKVERKGTAGGFIHIAEKKKGAEELGF